MIFGVTQLFAAIGANKMVIVTLGIVCASLLALNGGVLAFQPDLFLRLYDRQNPGDYWGKSAEWRKNIHHIEYKLLGLILLLSGLLFLGLLVKVVRVS